MKINIEFSQEYWQLITKAAKDKGQIEEQFIFEATIQKATSTQYGFNIEKEVHLFIEQQANQASIKKDLKSLWLKLKTIIFSKLYVLLLISYTLSLISIRYISDSLKNNSNFVNIKVFIILVLLLIVMISIIAMIASVPIISFYNNIGVPKIPSKALRIKKQMNIDAIKIFAEQLSDKYSIEQLKSEEEDYKDIINEIENRRKIASAGGLLFSLFLLLFIKYNSVKSYEYLINTFPNFFGGLSFVFFTATLITFILSLNYFDRSIFYKQALSGLQRAQTINNKCLPK